MPRRLVRHDPPPGDGSQGPVPRPHDYLAAAFLIPFAVYAGSIVIEEQRS